MMKKIILSLICVFSLCSFAVSEILSDNFFNQTDYEDIELVLLKCFAEHNYDDISFFKYGLCLEKLNKHPEIMENCFAISAFLFQNSDSKYINEIIEKVNEYDLDYSSLESIDVDKIADKISILYYVKIVRDPLIKISGYLLTLETKTKLLFLAIAFLLYVLAWFASMGHCVIVYTWWDMSLLIIAGSIFCLNLYSLYHGDGPAFGSKASIIFCVCFLISLFFSILGNAKFFPINILFILLSFFTKFILVILVPIVVLMIITAFDSGKEDKRYRDGTKDNKKSKSVALLFFVLSILVSPLVKSKNKSKISETVGNLSNEKYAQCFIQNFNRIIHQYK